MVSHSPPAVIPDVDPGEGLNINKCPQPFPSTSTRINQHLEFYAVSDIFSLKSKNLKTTNDSIQVRNLRTKS